MTLKASSEIHSPGEKTGEVRRGGASHHVWGHSRQERREQARETLLRSHDTSQ